MNREMPNQLYEEQQQQQQNGMFSAFGNFMKNPMQFLAQRKIQIPQEYANDPQAAVQYLLNSNQLDQKQLNSLIKFAQRMGVKI